MGFVCRTTQCAVFFAAAMIAGLVGVEPLPAAQPLPGTERLDPRIAKPGVNISRPASPPTAYGARRAKPVCRS